MAVKVLHAADLHIDSPLRGLPNDGLGEVARGATRRAFVRLVDFALAEGVQVVLLAGDVFDGDWKDAQTGQFFTQQLLRLTTVGVEVFLVLGNHDAEGKLSRLWVLPKGAHLFSAGEHAQTEIRSGLGIAVHGWSFPVQRVTDDPLPRFPKPIPEMVNFGLLHTNLDGGQGHSDYAPTRSAALFDHGYDYWALGHVHTRTVHEQAGRYIVYPGNLQGRHVRECPAPNDPGKGATLVTVEGGRITGLRHVSLDVLHWRDVSVDVSGVEDVPGAVDRAASALSAWMGGACPVAARVRLQGACAAHGALLSAGGRLREIVVELVPRDGGVFVEEVRVETRPARPPPDDALEVALRQVLQRIQQDPAVRKSFLDFVVGGLQRVEDGHPEVRAAMEDTLYAKLRPRDGGVQPALNALSAEAQEVLRARLLDG
jgi:predicted phosphodiesterase